MNIYLGMKILWIFLGVNKNWTSLGGYFYALKDFS